MNSKKQFTSGAIITSGAFLTSGRFVSSGAVLSSGAGDSAFLICDQIEAKAPMAFQLAPRTYLLTREIDDRVGSFGPASAAVADLPVQLAFRELSPRDRSRQCWASERVETWLWQLIVEQQGGLVAVKLTAAPASDDPIMPLIWRPRVNWEPFGANVLHPESVRAGIPPLIVKAS